MVACYVLFFVLPQDIVFSYSKKEYCVDRVIAFPDLYKQSGDKEFKLQVKGGFKLGNLYVFSSKVCLNLVTPPNDGNKSINFSPFKSLVFSSNYVVHIGLSPKIVKTSSQQIAINKPIKFTLSKDDNIFVYKFKVNEKTINCKNELAIIDCETKELGLKQGETYSYRLIRNFNNSAVSSIATGNISLLPPTKVVSTSVQDSEVIYSKPKSFKFETDKKLLSATVSLKEIDNDQLVSQTTTVTGSTIDVSIGNDLERGKSYRLTLESAYAEDGSTLETPYVVEFSTSNGPTVVGINIGTSDVASNATIVITFDQTLSQTQDISKLVSFSGGTATIGRSNNQITLKLNSLPLCKLFSISIGSGISNQYDISSSDSWSYTSRTSCRSTEVIGYSVQGRPIVAYFYGSGSTIILFTGGIHGNEQSGKYIMQDWASYLDANAYSLPADKQIVIVPAVNPDGLASSIRYNANNVNIDANFAAANWQSNINGSDGIIVNGGGPYPMSEPETKALANLTSRLHPRLEVSFHSRGSLVGANQYGDSTAIGGLYASSVGYANMIGIADETMGYIISGEYEEWAGEQYSIPAILIELPSSAGRYFSSNLSTIWKIVNL